MNKDSFVFYRDWYIALKGLKETVRHEVYEAIMRKVFDGIDSDLSSDASVAMLFISPLLERDMEKYRVICEQRKAFGKRGGVAKATKSKQKVAKGSKSKQNVASVADNDIQDTNVSMSISNNQEKEKDISTKNKKSYPADFESDWNLYERKGSKKDSYAAWKELSDDEKTKMRLHIPHYLQSNERQYLKDFERYIKHRVFESPVYHQSNLLFDPQTIENNQAGLYDPSGWLNYDERFQAWRYFGREPQYDLRDGYTDDNRPDKARVVTQATVYTWSAANKIWSVTK